ncbi:MAG: PD40 domain-containing protein [Acidobacteria bacterium]|nr:PD40 domain-containing protein [Acidobacteriota bacterium]
MRWRSRRPVPGIHGPGRFGETTTLGAPDEIAGGQPPVGNRRRLHLPFWSPDGQFLAFFLPDGRHFIYFRRSRHQENSAMAIGSLDSSEESKVPY